MITEKPTKTKVEEKMEFVDQLLSMIREEILINLQFGRDHGLTSFELVQKELEEINKLI